VREQSLLLSVIVILGTGAMLVDDKIPWSNLLEADDPELHIDLSIGLEEPCSSLEQATGAR